MDQDEPKVLVRRDVPASRKAMIEVNTNKDGGTTIVIWTVKTAAPMKTLLQDGENLPHC